MVSFLEKFSPIEKESYSYLKKQNHVVNYRQHALELMLIKLTLAVTFGFPSLSPPIQDPNFIGVQVNGSGFPVCCKGGQTVFENLKK